MAKTKVSHLLIKIAAACNETKWNAINQKVHFFTNKNQSKTYNKAQQASSSTEPWKKLIKLKYSRLN